MFQRTLKVATCQGANIRIFFVLFAFMVCFILRVFLESTPYRVTPHHRPPLVWGEFYRWLTIRRIWYFKSIMNGF